MKNTAKTVKVQVPMDSAVHDGLAERAQALGFDSVQAYIRFWAKAEVDNRNVDFGEDAWGEPSLAAAARLNKIASEAARGVNVSEPFSNAKEALKHLHSL